MKRFFDTYCAAALAAVLLAVAGLALAPAARADGSTDQPLSFAVDPSVKPQVEALDKAPVAAVADALGNQGDFVADELVLVTDDPGQLDGFLARWGGKVLQSVDPAEYRVDGLPKQYLVRIDTSLATTDTLDRDDAELAPGVGGPQRVSSEEGLRLLAAAAGERLGGLDVAVNWVSYPSTIRTRVATEASGTPNDFNWVNFCSAGSVPFIASVSCPQNIQVGEAWSELARASVLPAGSFSLASGRPVIAIVDGGYAATDADRPAVVNSFASGPSSVACSGGGACPFHGENMVSAAMGAVDNGFGAAGVAGPVANAMLLQSGGDVFTTTASLLQAAGARARVANMSFGGEIPAAFVWTIDSFDVVTATVRSLGTALVAASGNAEKDVDATATFIGIPFETAKFWPCESNGVICVGGLGFNSRSESIGSAFGAPGFGSNFGSGGLGDGTVDIWAPGVSVRVGLDPSPTTFITPNGVQMVSGTSVATPQVAGVIALVAAANPSLSEAAIESVLLGSAQAAAITPGKSKPVERLLAAEPAVATALGGDRPPELRITAPTAGSYSRGVVHATAFVSDDLSAPTVHWFVDGMEVKTGTNVDLELYAFPFGKYRITATAVDSHGWRTPDADGGVTISLTNDAPTMSISMPAPGAVYFFSFNRFTRKLTGDRVCLQGTSYDPNNKPSQLADSDVHWEIDGGAFTLGGHSAGIDATALGVGTHTVRFVGTDDGGRSGSASTSIEVREGLVANSGFTVIC